MTRWLRRASLFSLLFLIAAQPARCARYGPPAALWEPCDSGSFQTVLQAIPPGNALDARAVWFDRRLLRWPGAPASGRYVLHHSAQGTIQARTNSVVTGAERALVLDAYTDAVPAALADRFRWVGAGVTLAVRDVDIPRMPSLHQGQLVLVREDAGGRVLEATRVQIAGALDDLYAAATGAGDLGARVASERTRFQLWAPTARAVSACLYPSGSANADSVLPLVRDTATGLWQTTRNDDLSGRYFAYLVEVFVPGVGLVRNRVTDPYSLGLTTDSRRSAILSLDDPALKPEGWDATPHPARVRAQTDMVIYELHVRDFSAGDPTVRPEHRGKYLSFTEADSDGMRHLRALSDAGVTDLHLLPVFDLATIPESGCVTPSPSGAPDAGTQQATVVSTKAQDCFNWGYDPYHYTVPEGSYASDANDARVRILEFRRMVQALHQAGLRVGMDVVYNHTTASGQNERSVLDRIVPGYYHRLDANGRVTTSTCCDNTATENAMMEKLMVDSVVTWARDYALDSFRFDLMGHQPRAAMERLRTAVDAATGREVHLIGEGWNFGEVINGARFVQAAQISINGSGLGTFNDRMRDAARGGGCCDSGSTQVSAQGYLNGLVYDRNAQAPGNLTANDLMRTADMVRVGLAGSIRSFPLRTYRDQAVTLEQIDYFGMPAGYATAPDEVVNYTENHDNQTLFDLNAFKLPVATSREDRARVQVLGGALVAFAQGVAYLHGGQDLMRSKSMDRNSFDSGDWFNRVDWNGVEHTFGSGLPPQQDNGSSWPLMQPVLANPGIKPGAAEIAYSRGAYRDLLRIRSSSTLFRLRTADEIKSRLSFPNTGSTQVPTVIAGHLDGTGYDGAAFKEVLYFVNVDKLPHDLTLASEQGKAYVLHPVHRAPGVTDRRPQNDARYDAGTGRFTLPPRTALVYVVE